MAPASSLGSGVEVDRSHSARSHLRSTLMKEELAELQRLVAKLDPPWDGKRPPYGETAPKFDLETARAVLKRLEYNPHTDDSDTLFVELRMACDWIEEHKPIIDAARALSSPYIRLDS